MPHKKKAKKGTMKSKKYAYGGGKRGPKSSTKKKDKKYAYGGKKKKK